VAPPLNFGVSQLFGEFPGTISLSRPTFEFVVMEIVESLFHQGFRRFFVLNGGLNNQIPARLEDFQMEGVLRILWFDWWQSQAVRDFEAQHNLRLDHANWGENFPFNRVAESPAGEKPPVNLSFLAESYYSARAVLGDGSYGGPYQVDDALMLALFDRVVAEVAALVDSLRE
jgi:creatinine amidohydrolase